MEQIPGRAIDLPLVATLGTIRSHSARRISWHTHQGCELLFLLDGATAYEFRGAKSVELAGGHFLLVPPRVAHRGAHAVRMPSNLCGMQLVPWRRASARHTVVTAPDLRSIAERFQRATPTVRAMNGRLKHTLAYLVEEAARYKRGEHNLLLKASLRALVCEIVIESARLLSHPGKASPMELGLAAKEYLNRNFQEPVRMDDLAKHLGLSRARMFEVFRATTGMSPNDYLSRYRVDRARALLGATDRTVTDIAFSTGFSSSQYFCNVFRRYTGKTPGEVRR